MPFQVKFSENTTFVEAVYFGTVTQDELITAAKTILELSNKHNTMRLLADCSDVTGGHSAFDLYELADWMKAVAPKIKEALIFPSVNLASENIKFWENTCINRGLKVRIFNDRESALQWLTR